ncbi:MAG: phage integrase [Tardiphaga sp.]|jgi:integrase|nr:phage integrase [Tardiphaga sp.]
MARREPATGQRGGNSALFGKNVERRRETDDWNFKFKLGGEFYRGPCYTKDKRKAEAFAAQVKAEKKGEIRKDRAAGLGPMTFGHACDVWWDDVGSKNVETGLKYRLDWLREKLGDNKYLGEIKPDDITFIKNERAKCLRPAGKDDKGDQLSRPLTKSGVKATLVTLRSVINYASKAMGAAVRMFDWTTWIKKDDEEFDIRIMTETEQALIWPELDDDVREVAEFDLDHPKRINELLSLIWPRVDLLGETIRIKLKGRTKLFDDPIGPEEVMRLQRIKARKLHPMAVFTYASKRTRKYNGQQHVKGERRPMTYQHFYEKWTEACARVGITDLNPHCLRHTGATRYYWAHPDRLETVSKMLNHTDIATTVKYYAKHNPELAARAGRALHRDLPCHAGDPGAR